MRIYHDLDIYPNPREKDPLFVNEPWLIDGSQAAYGLGFSKQPENEEDNVRVYIPMDINRNAILRRVDFVIARYGAATEENEADFCLDIEAVLYQMEIYDQIWYVRNMPKKGGHSEEAKRLAKDIIDRLKNIPDSCAEIFPFELIEELGKEYLGVEYSYWDD